MSDDQRLLSLANVAIENVQKIDEAGDILQKSFQECVSVSKSAASDVDAVNTLIELANVLMKATDQFINSLNSSVQQGGSNPFVYVLLYSGREVRLTVVQLIEGYKNFLKNFTPSKGSPEQVQIVSKLHWALRSSSERYCNVVESIRILLKTVSPTFCLQESSGRSKQEESFLKSTLFSQLSKAITVRERVEELKRNFNNLQALVSGRVIDGFSLESCHLAISARLLNSEFLNSVKSVATVQEEATALMFSMMQTISVSQQFLSISFS